MAFADAKRQYMSWELNHFANEVAKRPIQWPDTFPIRTVLPLRVTLASGCDPKLIKTLCKFLWSLSMRYNIAFLSSSSMGRK